MTLVQLGVVGFRNLRDAVFDFPPEGIALIGRNAQGKSSLLEAIHYLETFRSFRSGADEELVRAGGDHFRVTARLRGPETGSRTVAAGFETSTRRKKVTTDGKEVARLGDAIGNMGTVLFTPDDVRLVSDGPQGRRRFLDVVLSINRPGYLPALQRFRHALTQRNAALREGSSGPSVRAWDPILIDAGARVGQERASWIQEFAPRFGDLYAEVSGGSPATMQYDPGIPGDAKAAGAEQLASVYAGALGDAQALDSKRRATQVGPHRDEVTFLLDGPDGERDLRAFGSGGERRTAALVLRILEAETVRAKRGDDPVLLMDDVFAELDEERSARVAALMERSARGQLVLTAPRESDLRFGGSRVLRWRVEGGEITQ